MEGTDKETGLSEILSLCIAEGLDARRLMARSASTSPRLKDPAPCLNSHCEVAFDVAAPELPLPSPDALAELVP